jgi:KTSC domain
VDLAPFACNTITRSSLVRRVCYDKREPYMIISLNGTYYHYCEIAPSVVAGLLRAESMGRHYNAVIKGHFDCRINRVPSYYSSTYTRPSRA